jgi:hypothetical protein
VPFTLLERSVRRDGIDGECFGQPISGQIVQKKRRWSARSATIIVLMLPTYVPPLAEKLVPRFVFR